MIKFYWTKNRCSRTCRPGNAARRHLAHVLARLHELVVKETHGAGGYGMLIGRRDEGGDRSFPRAALGPARQLHRAADARALGVPDLRRERHRAAPYRPAPFVLSGKNVTIVPGGLTRVRCARARWS